MKNTPNTPHQHPTPPPGVGWGGDRGVGGEVGGGICVLFVCVSLSRNVTHACLPLPLTLPRGVRVCVWPELRQEILGEPYVQQVMRASTM